MAPPSIPTLFLFVTFFTFAFISIDAREMTYFSKYTSNDPDTVIPSSTKPETYNPSKDENKKINPFGSRFDQHFKQYEHSENENKPHTIRYDTSIPSKTRPDYYNSNPFKVEKEDVPSGNRGYATIPKKNNHEDGEPMGTSDTRTMADGAFFYNLNDRSKHGLYYNSQSGRNSEVNREGGAHGQQYYSNREDSFDPQTIYAYDP